MRRVIEGNKKALMEYEDDPFSASFVVFRTPLRYLNNPDTVEALI